MEHRIYRNSILKAKRQLQLLLAIAYLLLGLSLTNYTVAEALAIPRIYNQPTINGSLAEGEWRGAKKVSLTTETSPEENIAALVETDVFLMEDGENLYVAFVAYDPDTSKVRAYYQDHDQTGGHDIVGIVLDTFNDERQAFEFFANPFGVQRDAINDDVNRRYNSAWDGLWQSGGQINGNNYTVEMAIPLSQLRFASTDGQQTWGIDLVRFYPRDKNHRLSHIPQDRDISCYLCQIGKAEGFENVNPSLNLTLIPTLTTNSVETRNDPAVDDWQREDPDTEVGLDLRWGINQNTFLNATINPDFSQVEADTAQLSVNNTFSLFFPEKRTFFLDGADYFNTRTNIVHTRNIADPEIGAKVTGKTGMHTYALLTARDESTSFIIPGNQGSSIANIAGQKSDIAIARYRYDIADSSTLGVIFTDRSADDYRNTVTGIDGSFQITDSDRLKIQTLSSRSEYPLDIQTDFGQEDKIKGSAYVIDYNHRDSRWDWFGNYEDFGKDFRADLGFINRVDFTKVRIGGGHTWTFDNFAFNRLRWGGNWNKTHDQDRFELEEEVESYLTFIDGPMQSLIEVGLGVRDRFYNGEYFDEKFIVSYSRFQPSRELSAELFFNIEDRVDFANTQLGKSQLFNPEISYRFGRHFRAELDYTHQRFTVDDGLLFVAKLIDFRLNYQFNNRSFLRLTTQLSNVDRNLALYNDPDDFDSTNKNVATQLLYSYKINALSRFFLGYSDAGYQDDGLDQLEKTNKTFFFKFSYAWQ